MSELNIRPALPDGGPDFDPLSSYFERNPYEELKRMRESGRAWRHRGTLMPVVSFFVTRTSGPCFWIGRPGPVSEAPSTTRRLSEMRPS